MKLIGGEEPKWCLPGNYIYCHIKRAFFFNGWVGWAGGWVKGPQRWVDLWTTFGVWKGVHAVFFSTLALSSTYLSPLLCLCFQIHIIDFDDENNIINKNVLLHQAGEIWHIGASPADKAVLTTCYNKSESYCFLLSLGPVSASLCDISLSFYLSSFPFSFPFFVLFIWRLYRPPPMYFFWPDTAYGLEVSGDI